MLSSSKGKGEGQVLEEWQEMRFGDSAAAAWDRPGCCAESGLQWEAAESRQLSWETSKSLRARGRLA